MNDVENKDQSAKADAGKLQLSLVDTDAIKTIATLEKHDQDERSRLSPVFIKKTKKVKHSYYGLFKCPYCKNDFEAIISNVMRGKVHSCGCMKGRFIIESTNSHGDSKSRLYRIYHHIVERCSKPYCREYKWYGARGIKCEFKSYDEFKKFAIENGYNDELTVERIDVNGNYSPSNVTFVTQKQQARNTRRNVKIEYKGLSLCASEWAEILGFNCDTLTKRIRNGWSDEKALVTRTSKDYDFDLTLVHVSIIKDIREVRLFGTRKYGDPDNWKTVEMRRYVDALLRHALEFVDNPESVDAESGIPHYKHMACNMAFICEMMAGRVPQKCRTYEEVVEREG